MAHIYIIEGNPVVWARAGFNKNTLHYYDTQRDIKRYNRLLIENQHGDRPIFSGPLKLTISFFMPIPKKIISHKRSALEGKPHWVRPDSDNMLKYYFDMAQGVLFNDDAQFASLSVEKVYSSNPRTVFIIEELK